MALRAKEPKAGDWDFDGHCRPRGVSAYGYRTFSVGIFKWLPTVDGKGIKRSAVVKRIKGYTSDADDVYRRANAYIDQMEEQ